MLGGLELDASYRLSGNQGPFKEPLKGPWAAALKGGNGGGCLCVCVLLHPLMPFRERSIVQLLGAFVCCSSRLRRHNDEHLGCK